MSKYIVLDLEFNRSNNGFVSERNGVKLYNEIIQIGAVKLNAAREEIDSFSRIVKPSAYFKINNEVKQLTGISKEDIFNGIEFKRALYEFLEWGGDGSELITWSSTDARVLKENIAYHGIEHVQLPPCYDIQVMFDDQVSMDDRPMPLNYAIWKLGIKSKPAHNALNDAISTAKVFCKLDLSDGLNEYAV